MGDHSAGILSDADSLRQRADVLRQTAGILSRLLARRFRVDLQDPPAGWEDVSLLSGFMVPPRSLLMLLHFIEEECDVRIADCDLLSGRFRTFRDIVTATTDALLEKARSADVRSTVGSVCGQMGGDADATTR